MSGDVKVDPFYMPIGCSFKSLVVFIQRLVCALMLVSRNRHNKQGCQLGIIPLITCR